MDQHAVQTEASDDEPLQPDDPRRRPREQRLDQKESNRRTPSDALWAGRV